MSTPANHQDGRPHLRARVAWLATILTAVALLGLLAGCGGSSATARATGQHVSAGAFAQFANAPGTTVLDVRTPEEYALGHLPGAVNLDVNSADFEAKLVTLNLSGEYALYCHSGNRSGQAMAQMSAKGFTHVSDLAGGTQAWVADGRALTAG